MDQKTLAEAHVALQLGPNTVLAHEFTTELEPGQWRVIKDRARHRDPFDFDALQAQVKAWADANFPDGNPNLKLLGVSEEMGELGKSFLEGLGFIDLMVRVGVLDHAQLKGEQKIRYTAEEIAAMKADAVGDILVYLANYCTTAGVDMQQAIERTWAKVAKRDWVADPIGAANLADEEYAAEIRDAAL